MVPMPEIVMRMVVRDLGPGDLESCGWAGTATHLAAIARALERARRGEVEYLAACPPSGLPVGLGAIDYAKAPGAGTIWMLEVHPALQSCGIGTVLIQAAEQRIRARGLHRAELGVEDGNPRARALYERLGYAAYGSEPDFWDQEAVDGTITRYETMLTLMRKELPAGMPRSNCGPPQAPTASSATSCTRPPWATTSLRPGAGMSRSSAAFTPAPSTVGLVSRICLTARSDIITPSGSHTPNARATHDKP